MGKNICPGCKCSVEKCRCIDINKDETPIGQAKIAKSETAEDKRNQHFSARSISRQTKPWEILGIAPLKLTQKQIEDLFKVGG